MDRPSFVAVISQDDIYALRVALVVEHAQPGMPLLITVSDATVASQLIGSVPNCRVVSLADVAAPVLTDDCVPEPTHRAGARALLGSQLRPYDTPRRLLVSGIVGLGRGGHVIVVGLGRSSYGSV